MKHEHFVHLCKSVICDNFSVKPNVEMIESVNISRLKVMQLCRHGNYYIYSPQIPVWVFGCYTSKTAAEKVLYYIRTTEMLFV